eukprot:5265273-Prymnesium_polylepis.1
MACRLQLVADGACAVRRLSQWRACGAETSAPSRLPACYKVIARQVLNDGRMQLLGRVDAAAAAVALLIGVSRRAARRRRIRVKAVVLHAASAALRLTRTGCAKSADYDRRRVLAPRNVCALREAQRAALTPRARARPRRHRTPVGIRPTCRSSSNPPAAPPPPAHRRQSSATSRDR